MAKSLFIGRLHIATGDATVRRMTDHLPAQEPKTIAQPQRPACRASLSRKDVRLWKWLGVERLDQLIPLHPSA